MNFTTEILLWYTITIITGTLLADRLIDKFLKSKRKKSGVKKK